MTETNHGRKQKVTRGLYKTIDIGEVSGYEEVETVLNKVKGVSL